MIGTSLRVLVVDDSRDDFELLLRALTVGGFHVEEARRVETEKEMLAALDEGWDVVCVDWVMPACSAPDVLRVLSERADAPPCIVVSGVVGEETAVMAIKLGARDFVRKDRIRECAVQVLRELIFAGRLDP